MTPLQVTALGHSAGAQLLAMDLIHRARQASQQSPTKGRRKAAAQIAAAPDCRMPARFIGVRAVAPASNALGMPFHVCVIASLIM